MLIVFFAFLSRLFLFLSNRQFLLGVSEGVLTEHEIVTVAREFGEKMVGFIKFNMNPTIYLCL